MSESDADEPQARDSALEAEVNDPEEYVNTRRLEQIFDIRADLHDRRFQIRTAQYDPRVSRFEALCGYRSLVDSYILEVEDLLERYEPGPELLYDREFGYATVTPEIRHNGDPQVREPAAASQSTGEWVTVEDPERDPRIWQLQGLVSLFDLPDPLRATWTFEKDLHTRSEQFTHTNVTQVGFGVLDDMVREVNSFLAEIGLSIDPDEGSDVASVDYSDIL